MSKDFTYENSTNGYVVRFPVNTRVKFNNSYKKVLGLAFNVTKGHEATVLTTDNRWVIISLEVYAQLPDDDKYIPYAWKHLVGVRVDTEAQAKDLINELDMAVTWNLLTR
jgi:hypothetical protein